MIKEKIAKLEPVKIKDLCSSKDIIDKAVVFPVVMYGCEGWTVKKASTKELMLLNCGVGEDC